MKYLNSAYYIVLFFVLKIAKCRDFDQKINQTPLLHSDKFSKVKYLNSANYIVLFHESLVKQIFHFSTKIKRNVYVWQFVAEKRERYCKRNLSIPLPKICRCVVVGFDWCFFVKKSQNVEILIKKSIKPHYYTATNFRKWNT